MVKNEIYDSMERGYSDTVASSTPTPTTHARNMSKVLDKEKEQLQRALSEPYEHNHGHPLSKRQPMTLEGVGRAIAARGVRALRRGNLPFMIVFVTALFVFFGALAGIGYVDPDAQALAPESEFVMGQPVFDPAEGQRLRELAMQEQRALEQQWAKKKRPNAGAWMKKQRNDGAVRAGAVAPADENQGQFRVDDQSEAPVAEHEDKEATEASETNEDNEAPHNHDDH